MTPASKKKKRTAAASTAASKNTAAATKNLSDNKQSVATNDVELITRILASENMASMAAIEAENSAVSAHAAGQLALGAWCDDEVNKEIEHARNYAEEARRQNRDANEILKNAKADSRKIKNAQNSLIATFSVTKTFFSAGNAERCADRAELYAKRAQNLAPKSSLVKICDR